MTSSTIYDRVTRASQNIDRQVAPSVIRHMYATLLSSLGVPEQISARMLGLRVDMSVHDLYCQTTKTCLDKINIDQYWSGDLEPDIW